MRGMSVLLQALIREVALLRLEGAFLKRCLLESAL
jgi:hypothetical protein